ncbi:MAG: hypothetical protein AAFZ87_08760 [Planctomycetota bacterium]
MDWDYPVYKPKKAKPQSGSVGRSVSRALAREKALEVIAGDDPRPLLVLRECKVCNGTDEALLKGGADNEKTFLLARWFHCVKLPVDVMEEDHPFHNLFTEETPEHLFVCSLDGSNHDALQSDTSRVELWESMTGLLANEYEKKPQKPLKTITRLLDKMDTVDQRLAELIAKREAVLEKEGPKSRKLKKLQKDISKAQEEVKGYRSEISKVSSLKLKADRKKAKEAKKAKGAPAGA